MKMDKIVIAVLVVIVLVGGGLAVNKFILHNSVREMVSQSAPGQTQGPQNGNVTVPISQTVPSESSPVITSQIKLNITSPLNNSTSKVSTVVVKGTTVPNADVAVNDVDGKADAQGNFSVTINLDEGDNTIDVVANDAEGNVSEQELTVNYSPS